MHDTSSICACAVQIIRELVPPLARWVSNNRVTMSLLNNGTLIIIVWIQLCSAHERLFQQPFQDIVLIIIGAILLHFVFVAINWPIITYAGLVPLSFADSTCPTMSLNNTSATRLQCLLPNIVQQHKGVWELQHAAGTCAEQGALRDV